MRVFFDLPLFGQWWRSSWKGPNHSSMLYRLWQTWRYL